MKKNVAAHGDDEHQYDDDDDIIDPAVQRGYGSVSAGKSAARPQSSSAASAAASAAAPSSFAVKFGKKIRQKLSVGPAGAEARPSSSKRESGAGRTSSRKVEYEEMEDMHWSEI